MGGWMREGSKEGMRERDEIGEVKRRELERGNIRGDGIVYAERRKESRAGGMIKGKEEGEGIGRVERGKRRKREREGSEGEGGKCVGSHVISRNVQLGELRGAMKKNCQRYDLIKECYSKVQIIYQVKRDFNKNVCKKRCNIW